MLPLILSQLSFVFSCIVALVTSLICCINLPAVIPFLNYSHVLGTVTEITPECTVKSEIPVYQTNHVLLAVKNRFGVAGTFEVSLHESIQPSNERTPVLAGNERDKGALMGPVPFFTTSQTQIRLPASDATSTPLTINFTPFDVSVVDCLVRIYNSKLGVVIFKIKGTATPPAPTDPSIQFTCGSEKSVVVKRMVRLNYANSSRDRALAMLLPIETASFKQLLLNAKRYKVCPILHYHLFTMPKRQSSCMYMRTLNQDYSHQSIYFGIQC